MRDISARELKGHNILEVKRFHDKTKWMLEFVVVKPNIIYGHVGDEVRLFVDDEEYNALISHHKRKEIRIKKYARIVEGHILEFKPCKHLKHK